MLGDMFNHSLKARVDGLCQAIAGHLARQPELFPAGSFQSQSQSGGGQQMQVGSGSGQQMQVGGGQQMQTGPAGMAPMTPMAPIGTAGGGLFSPDPRDSWWPKELGSPSAIGSQNDVRYAFFPATGRLAIEANGRVSVYDTGEHQIAGLSQQQGPAGAVVFSTPGGSISLSSLTPVSGAGAWQQAQSSAGGSQQQQQGGSGMAPMGSMGGMAPMGGMEPMNFAASGSAEPWWPRELGSPGASGAQNDLRYAVFPAARRLAVERNGRVSVHDTGDLQISGCSQASGEAGVRVTTSSGTVSLASLPELPAARTAAEPVAPPQAWPSAQESEHSDVLDALARLGELKEKGILTEEEFAAKKAELLRRL
jgi:hypothetical protein